MEVHHMEMASFADRRRGALAVVACAALIFTFALVPQAFAFQSSGGVQYTHPCAGCHSAAAPAPVVTLVSNDGITATYTVAGNGLEWAVFNGTTHVAGSAYSDGNTFSVPVGVTYTVYDVVDESSAGQTSVTPAGGSSNFTIVPTAGANGTISPATTATVSSGSDATFTITPSPGYHVGTLTVDGSAVTAATSYVFHGVTANHTIAVTFAADGTTTNYTITPTAGANGSISPATAQSVASGSNATLTITPSSGYHVATLTVDGSAVTAATSYVFQNVTANHSISVTFAADVLAAQYTLTGSVSGGHGSIAPAAAVTVDVHASYSFRIQPDVGYHVDTVLVDGQAVTLTTGGLYTFSNVTANHSVVVTFAAGALPGSVALLPTGGAGGTVGPVVSAYVYGPIITLTPHSSYTFRVKADLGYHVDTVLVDSQPATLTSGGLYTFSNITAVHTFAVTFAPNASTSVSLKRSASSVKHGKSVTLSSVLAGGVAAGTKVTFQVKAPGKSNYATISSVGVSSKGAASVKYKLSKKGSYYFRAVFAGNAAFAPCTSASVKVTSK
jgi:hypothetical protein